MLLVLLAACGMRATTGPTDADRALAAADAAWAARSEPGKLDTAMEAWLAQLALLPEDPQVLARLAQGEWTRGQLAGAADAVAHFETGEDYGYRCLLTWPGVASHFDAQGYRVTSEAAASIPDAAAGCLLWTAVNALSVVDARGAGGALGLEAAGALVDRLADFGLDGHEGMGPWLAAKRRLLTPSVAADVRQEARALLHRAVDEAPGQLFFRAELVAAFPDEGNRALDGFVHPTPDPWALENARSADRLQALGITVGEP
jgi:hypothetical protein